MVFSTTELVLCIFDYLDEVSLIRVSSACKAFHNIVNDTKSIRDRLGLVSSGVGDKARDSSEVASIKWNSLLNWVALMQLSDGQPTFLHSDDAAIFVALPISPQAMRRVPLSKKNWAASSLYQLSVTLPPVKEIRVWFAAGRRPNRSPQRDVMKHYLFNEYGVTIGQLLGLWAKQSISVRGSRIMVAGIHANDRTLAQKAALDQGLEAVLRRMP